MKMSNKETDEGTKADVKLNWIYGQNQTVSSKILT